MTNNSQEGQMKNASWLLVLPVTLLSLVMLIVPSRAAAQSEEHVLADQPEIPAEKASPGWKPMLKASGTFAMTHSQHMVGTTDGTSVNLGFLLNSGLDYLHRAGHMWSSTLDWQLNYNYTSMLDRFTKGLDAFNLTTSYLYKIPKAPYIGPYLSFTLKTSIFKGYEVRAVDTQVIELDKDGNQIQTYEVPAKKNIDLTSFFSPTTLKESAGLFGDLIDEKPVKLQLRAGVGTWEIFVRGGFALADVGTTPQLEIKALFDSVQFGGELGAVATGSLFKAVGYTLKASLMYPFVDNVDTPGLSGFDLVNIEVEYLVGVKITKWASIDWSLKAYHVPLLYSGWQIQTGLFLTLTADIL
jgi:hypothetical protein